MNRTSVLAALEAHLLQSLERAQSQVASLQESLTSESKSTAGDKHETGRAMIQQALEQAVLAQNRASENLVGFRKITAGSPSQVVAPGSLVYTPKAGSSPAWHSAKCLLRNAMFLAFRSHCP